MLSNEAISTNVEIIKTFSTPARSTNIKEIKSTSVKEIDMIQLGYLEETVLLLVMIMDEEAYGFTVSQEYEKQTGKSISISAVHTVLSRMEKKGYIESQMGGATEDRGGRKKRIFKITNLGVRVIQEIKQQRQKLWNQVPNLS